MTHLVLTVAEVADVLQLPRHKVYPLIEEQLISGFKVGASWRVTRASVEQFLRPVAIAPTNESDRRRGTSA